MTTHMLLIRCLGDMAPSVMAPSVLRSVAVTVVTWVPFVPVVHVLAGNSVAASKNMSADQTAASRWARYR